MFVELQAVYHILSKYEVDPSLARKQIGTWSAWEEELAENDLPLSPEEVGPYATTIKKICARQLPQDLPATRVWRLNRKPPSPG